MLIKKSPGNFVTRLLSAVGQGPLQRHNAEIARVVKPWRQKGVSLHVCCSRLNRDKKFTFRGRAWRIGRLASVLSENVCVKK